MSDSQRDAEYYDLFFYSLQQFRFAYGVTPTAIDISPDIWEWMNESGLTSDLMAYLGEHGLLFGQPDKNGWNTSNLALLVNPNLAERTMLVRQPREIKDTTP